MDGRKLRELFYEAIELPANERAAFVARLENEAMGLRDALAALLDDHEASDGFLEEPPARPDAPVEPRAGDRVGQFELIEPIGEGGMGVVWRARQFNPRRQVAVKLLRGRVSAEALRRFELESEALGRLRHPGIAQVYEAGVADLDGRRLPYLALEFVDGRPLTEHASQRDLSVEERLRLFLPICHAANHAHQNGVIHRDLKPGNILVDRQGRPRILDFGIARVEDDTRRQTLQTRAGELIGTLAYMSPEQLETVDTIDTRADVYALGAVLYELLSGRLPIDVTGCGVGEAVSRITRQSPAPLPDAIPRDLRTIVGKALERDREARYSSASELAADLSRYLADEPILAHPPSALYLLRKFTRRHRALVTVAGLALAALVVAAVVAAVGWVQASVARDRADRQARRAQEFNRILRDALESPSPYVDGHEYTMVEFLDRTRERLGAELADRPLLRADLYGTLGTTYLELGELEVAEELLRGAVDRLGAEGDDWLSRTVELRTSLSLCQANRDALDAALATAREAAETAEVRLAPEDLNRQLAFHTYGTLLDWAEELEQAERWLRLALEESERNPDANELELLTTRAALAEVLRRRDKRDEAASLMTRVYEERRRLLGEDAPVTLDTLNNLAFLYKDLGDDRRAEELFRRSARAREEAYGAENPRTAVAVHNLGWMLVELGRFEEARPHAERAVELAERVHGTDHWVVGAFRLTLGRVYRGLGDSAAARREFEASVALTSAGLGQDHERVQRARQALAELDG